MQQHHCFVFLFLPKVRIKENNYCNFKCKHFHQLTLINVFKDQRISIIIPIQENREVIKYM